jgi:hypothetical protein
MSELVKRDNITIYGLPANPTIGTIAVDISDGVFKKYNGSTWVPIGGVSGSQSIAFLSDVKASGTTTTGGTSGSWIARNLNTLIDPSGIILNPSSFTGTGGTNSTITLGVGTYFVEGFASSFSNTVGRLRVRNTTDTTTAAVGLSLLDNSAASHAETVSIKGSFTIAATKSFQLQHFINTTGNTFGSPVSNGDVEVYVMLKITKTA